MYEFRNHTRSAWRKSVERAAKLVAAGKMPEEEFAAAPDSPHPGDPKPAALLAAARRNREAELAWEAGAADRAAARRAEEEAHEQRLRACAHEPAVIVAGEDSKIVFRGTLEDCMAMASMYESGTRRPKCRRSADGWAFAVVCEAAGGEVYSHCISN